MFLRESLIKSLRKINSLEGCRLNKCLEDNIVSGYSYSIFFAITTFLVFWPGIYSADSFSQISEAVSNKYTTWHPPMMAWIMHVLYGGFGVGGILFLNQILYWTGIWRFLVLIKMNNLILLIFIGFFPPIYTLSLHVLKDACLIIFFLWVINFLIAFLNRRNLTDLFLFLLFCFFCFSMRINAFIPIFVLIFFATIYIYKSLTLKKILNAIFISLITIIAFFGFNDLFNKSIDAHISNPLPTLLLWDIAGIANNANIKFELPSYAKIDKSEKLDNWQKKYWPNSCNKICWGNGVNCGFSEDYNSDLLKKWKDMVLKYPKDYLKHRIDLATRLYGFKKSQQYGAFQGFTTDLKKGPQFQVSYLGRKVYSQITNIDNFLISIHLYQYLVYGLVSLIILCLSIFEIIKKNTDFILPIMLSMAGLVNASSLFFITVAADYRYIAFSVLTSLLSLISYISLRKNVNKI